MASSEVLVARQPIFDAQLNVEAYELLARASTLAETFAELNASTATAKVLSDAFLQMDIRSVTGGLPAYINFTQDLLLDDSASALPPEFTVIEVLEDVEVLPEVVDAIVQLRSRGFKIAIDDCVGGDPRLALLPHVDTVKVDFLQSTPLQRKELVRAAREAGCHIVAEKIESQETFNEAKGLGFDAFQGYFFQKPALVRGRRVTGARLSYLTLLKAVNAPEMDFAAVEAVIKRDVSLAWKFLNYLNAAYFGWRTRVDSIRRGLVLLGENGVRRWVSLIAITAIGEDVPTELVSNAIVRARFSESLAAMTDSVGALDAFLAGMFSLLDAMLDEPLADILRQVSVPPTVATAILDLHGDLGAVLRMVMAYERGSWANVHSCADQLGIDVAELTPLYLDALSWTRNAMPSRTPAAV